MEFPKNKMHLVSTHDGKESTEGWLVLDLSKVDTEGVSRIYIDLTDVKSLQSEKGEQADVFKKTLDLLSLDEE